jgi:Protein of unknown function (DUF551)
MSGWININEKKPYPGAIVLAYTDADRIVVRKFCKYKFSEMTDKVTHWMPLPNPPKDAHYDDA